MSPFDPYHQWLGIPEAMLQNPGPVSREVACAMATGVLERTPEADYSVAITGHLGPNAPAEQDGLIWIAAAHRTSSGTTILGSVSRQLSDRAEAERPRSRGPPAGSWEDP